MISKWLHYAHLCKNVCKFRVEIVLYISRHGSPAAPHVRREVQHQAPHAHHRHHVVEADPVVHVVLLELWLALPHRVPELPADAGKDGAGAHGDDAGDDDQLDPVDHVERVHVD